MIGRQAARILMWEDDRRARMCGLGCAFVPTTPHPVFVWRGSTLKSGVVVLGWAICAVVFPL
jgi:hypothetical protein